MQIIEGNFQAHKNLKAYSTSNPPNKHSNREASIKCKYFKLENAASQLPN